MIFGIKIFDMFLATNPFMFENKLIKQPFPLPSCACDNIVILKIK